MKKSFDKQSIAKKVKFNDFSTIEKIESIEPIDEKDLNGYALIHYAAQNGNLAIIMRLRELGADIKSVTKSGYNILHLAASGGHLNAVKGILGLEFSIDKTALIASVKGGNLHLLEYLLRKREGFTEQDYDLILRQAIESKKDDIANYILDKYEIDIDSRDEYGRTFVYQCAESGSKEVLINLLKQVADVNIPDLEGHYPLSVAISRADKEITGILLGRHAIVGDHLDTDNYRTMLQQAIYTENLEYVEYVKAIDEYGVDYFSLKNVAALLVAVQLGNLEITKYLIEECKAEIRCSGIDHRQIMHYVASCPNDNIELVQYLMQYDQGDLIDVLDNKGRTPLHDAAENNNTQIAYYFMGYQKSLSYTSYLWYQRSYLDINIEDKEGVTPLQVALKKGASDIVEALLYKGAGYSLLKKIGPMNPENSQKIAELIYDAAESGDLSTTEYITEFLKNNLIEIEFKKCINATSINGYGVLHFAAAGGDISVIEYLMGIGVDDDLINDKNCTILHFAKNIHVAQYFFEKNNRLANVKDRNGDTPFHKAAKEGNCDLIEFYLIRQVKFDTKNYYDKTVIDEVISRNNILDILERVTNNLYGTDHGKIFKEVLKLAATQGNLRVIQQMAKKIDISPIKDDLTASAIQNERLEIVKFLVEELQASFNLKNIVGNEGYAVADYLLSIKLGDQETFSPEQKDELIDILREAVSQGSRLVKYLISIIGEQYLAKSNEEEPINLINLAAKNGHIELVKYFISKGVPITSGSINFEETVTNIIETASYAERLFDEKEETEEIWKYKDILLNRKLEEAFLSRWKFKIKAQDKNTENNESDDYSRLEPILPERLFSQVKKLSGGHVQNDDSARHSILANVGISSSNIYAQAVNDSSSDSDDYDISPVIFDDVLDSLYFFQLVSDNHILKVKQLINNKQDANIANKLGWSLLHEAVACNYLEMVKFLIGVGADPFAEDIYGKTIMHVAMRYADSELIGYLKSQNVGIQKQDKDGITPAHEALFCGRESLVIKHYSNVRIKDQEDHCLIFHLVSHYGTLDQVKKLITPDLLTVDNQGLTPIYYAVRYNSIEVFKHLYSIVSNYPVFDSYHPMHEAARCGRLDIVKYLYEECKIDVNIHAAQGDKRSSLHYASEFAKNFDVVKYLLGVGADINAVNVFHETALSTAIKFGNHKIVKLLLENRIDTNIFANKLDPQIYKEFLGKLPNVRDILILKEIVSSKQPQQYIDFLDDVEIERIKSEYANEIEDIKIQVTFRKKYIDINLLTDEEIEQLKVKYQIDIDAQFEHFLPPLHNAIQLGEIDIAKSILQYANINFQDNNGRTPIHIAIDNGHLGVIQDLIGLQCNLNIKDNNGCTPLHIAISKQNMKLCAALAAHQDVDLKDYALYGDILLYVIMQARNEDNAVKMISDLLDAGANINNKYKDDFSLLDYATELKYSELFKLLIERGAVLTSFAVQSDIIYFQEMIQMAKLADDIVTAKEIPIEIKSSSYLSYYWGNTPSQTKITLSEDVDLQEMLVARVKYKLLRDGFPSTKQAFVNYIAFIKSTYKEVFKGSKAEQIFDFLDAELPKSNQVLTKIDQRLAGQVNQAEYTGGVLRDVMNHKTNENESLSVIKDYQKKLSSSIISSDVKESLNDYMKEWLSDSVIMGEDSFG